MTEEPLVINDSGRSLYDALDRIRVLQAEHGYIVITVKRVGAQRTNLQNRSLHLWLGMVSDCLNDHDIGHKAIWKAKAVDVPWTMETVKAELFRPILKALADKDSTADANTKHYGRVEQILAKHIAENFGVTLPEWPQEKNKPQEKQERHQ